MSDITEFPFSFWPSYINKQTEQHNTQYSVATTNPWILMNLEIARTISDAKLKEICLACLDQAEFFHNAQSTVTNYPAKALLIYYSSMNLVKAYLMARGFCTDTDRSFLHGLKYVQTSNPGDKDYDPLKLVFTLEKPKSDDANEKNKASKQHTHAQYKIFYEFLRSFTANIPEGEIKISDILPQIVIGHRIFSQSHSKKELFIPLTDINFIRDSTDKTLTINCKFQSKHYKRNKKAGEDFLKTCNLSSDAKMRSSEKNTSHRSFSLTPIKYEKNAVKERSILASRLKNRIWVIITAQEPYRKYYLYAGNSQTALPPLCSIYALMYCLGDIARYRPHRFNDILQSKDGPQVIDFLTSIPNQFLYLLASELLQKDIERPSVP